MHIFNALCFGDYTMTSAATDHLILYTHTTLHLPGAEHTSAANKDWTTCLHCQPSRGGSFLLWSCMCMTSVIRKAAGTQQSKPPWLQQPCLPAAVLRGLPCYLLPSMWTFISSDTLKNVDDNREFCESVFGPPWWLQLPLPDCCGVITQLPLAACRGAWAI